MPKKTAILVVCLGNICRSPAAEGALRFVAEREGRLDDFIIDSAGTGSWHIGDAPDLRSQAACRKRGFDIASHRARQVTREDFNRFDWILACDRDNYAALSDLMPEGCRAKLEFLLRFGEVKDAPIAVPDPYYGRADGFEYVVQLCLEAAEGILRRIPRTE